MGEHADDLIAKQQRDYASQQMQQHTRARPGRKVTKLDPQISAAAIDVLRAAQLGHDYVDLPPGRLPAPVYAEVRSVLRQLGAEWHGGRKLHVFTRRWSAETFAASLKSGRRPE